MGEFPNKATQFKKGAKQVAIAKKAGSTPTPKKSIAAKIRELKKKGLQEEAAQELFDLMTSSDLDALDIQIYLKRLEKACQTPEQKLSLARARMEHFEKKFGQKLRVQAQNTNINLNVNVSDEYVKRFKEKYGEITGR